jgi:hypothetical protein
MYFGFCSKKRVGTTHMDKVVFMNLQTSTETSSQKAGYQVHDQLGDGCEVQFPVRMHSKVKWEHTVFIKDEENGTIAPKNRSFEEVCVICLLKQRVTTMYMYLFLH